MVPKDGHTSALCFWIKVCRRHFLRAWGDTHSHTQLFTVCTHLWWRVCVWRIRECHLAGETEFKQITEEKSDHYATQTLCFTCGKQVGAWTDRMEKSGGRSASAGMGRARRNETFLEEYALSAFKWCKWVVGSVKQHVEIPFMHTNVHKRGPGLGYSDTCWSTGNFVLLMVKKVFQKLEDSACLIKIKIPFQGFFNSTKCTITALCPLQWPSNKMV